MDKKTTSYQYKRELLSDDEVNSLTNACDTFREKFVVWTFLDTGLRLSEFADLKKGLSTRALQTLLGHDRLTTTELYLNLSPEDASREFLNKW